MKKRILFTLVFLLLIVVLLFPFNPAPLSKQEITSITYRVFEYSAIHAPHNILFKPDDFKKHRELFKKVESGNELNAEESKAYRLAYQSILKNNQFIFGFLDSNLTILNDVNMEVENNVNGNGIAGKHDHHDASTRSNLNDMIDCYESLLAGKSSSEIFDAKLLYKNTMDVMLHLGTVPQVKSTQYQTANAKSGGKIAELIEQSLLHFKNAQFENINSQAYWAEIRLALDVYVEAVILVQALVQEKLSAIELSIAGSWDSWKNFAPMVSDDIKVRQPWLSVQ